MLEEITPDLSHKGGVKVWTSSGYLIRVLHLHSEQPGALPGQMTTKLGWGWGWGIRRQAGAAAAASRLLPAATGWEWEAMKAFT